MKDWKLFLFILSLAFGGSVFSQNIDTSEFVPSRLPGNEKEKGTPFYYYFDDFHNQLHNANKSYSVKINRNNMLVIEEDSSVYDRVIRFEVYEGWWIAINDGEFGGALYFLPIQNRDNPQFITRGNFEEIFFFNDYLLALEGLNMGTNKGGIYSLREKEGNLLSEKKLELDAHPRAHFIFQDNLYIVTDGGLAKINANLEMEQLFTENFWDGLYVNSLVILDERNAYAGIRGGYIQFDLIQKSVRLFINPDILDD